MRTLIHGNFPKNDSFELKNILSNRNKSKALKYLIVGCLGQFMGKYRQK